MNELIHLIDFHDSSLLSLYFDFLNETIEMSIEKEVDTPPITLNFIGVSELIFQEVKEFVRINDVEIYSAKFTLANFSTKAKFIFILNHGQSLDLEFYFKEVMQKESNQIESKK